MDVIKHSAATPDGRGIGTAAGSRPTWRYPLPLVLSLLLPAVIAGLVVDLARRAALDLTELHPWFLNVRSRAPDTVSVLTAAATGLAIYGLVLMSLEGGRARRVWLLPGLSAVSAGMLLAIFGLALVRFSGRPAIDAHVDKLWNATHEVPPPGVECLQPHPAWPVTTHPRPPGAPARPLVMGHCPGAEGIRMSSIGGLGVLQACHAKGCLIELAPTVDELRARRESRSPDPMRSWSSSLHDAPFQEWDDAVRFTLEPSGRVLFVQASDVPPPHHRPALRRPREFGLVEGRWKPVDFSAARIAEKTSAPSAWLWTGLVGLVLSGMLFALRRRLASRRSVLEAARPAVLGEDGRLTLENGTVARMESASGVPSGPALVLREVTGSAYREGGVLSRKDVLPGSLEEQLAKLRFDLLRCDAAAVAVAWLAAAPLVGATLAGLLLPAGASAAEPSPLTSSVPTVSSSGAASLAPTADSPHAVSGSTSDPAPPAPKPVPKRACTRDEQCGEDGFCDRGRCAPVQGLPLRYGKTCQTSSPRECGNLPCIDGRCRSCVSDVECEWARHVQDPKCVGDTFAPGSRACIGVVLSLPSRAAPPPPPRP